MVCVGGLLNDELHHFGTGGTLDVGKVDASGEACHIVAYGVGIGSHCGYCS